MKILPPIKRVLWIYHAGFISFPPVPSISGPFWSGVWSSCGSPSWWEEATSWRTLPIHWWPVIRGTSGCWSAYGKSKCLLLGRWIDISVIIYFVWELNKFFLNKGFLHKEIKWEFVIWAGRSQCSNWDLQSCFLDAKILKLDMEAYLGLEQSWTHFVPGPWATDPAWEELVITNNNTL